MAIRVGVFGAAGKMGTTVCHAIAADPDLALVAAVDPFHEGETVEGVTIAASADALAEAGAEVAVDFTHVSAARGNVAWCAANGVHAVVGTSGLVEADLADLAAQFTRSNCVVGPNFAIGAVLMMRFAEMAARYFDSAEIIELHHDQKVDAPSGTAMHTAQLLAAASPDWSADPTKTVKPSEAATTRRF